MLHAIYPDKFQTKHFVMGLILQVLGFNCPKKCGYNNIFIETTTSTLRLLTQLALNELVTF